MDLLPEGKFQARAIAAELGMSGSGNPSIGVAFTILDGPCQGRTIVWYGSFSKNKGDGKKSPFERTIESLATCGWRGNTEDFTDGTFEQDVSITVIHDSYQGETRAKVQWVNRPGGGITHKAEMNDAQKKAFAAQIKGDVMYAMQSIQQPSPAPSKNKMHHGYQQDAPPITDDDVLF